MYVLPPTYTLPITYTLAQHEQVLESVSLKQAITLVIAFGEGIVVPFLLFWQCQ